ncbi:hypothetical protein L596_000183 [Steinernema carpocapsae]|uniref:Uncharacterized protein n=1 Tax=Steinernema carpocapsae TaxID=34508 RepID=A0A4U8UIG5_STECR|nr:hypothetical protein L596_000183 [Steinernema carpocapsae]
MTTALFACICAFISQQPTFSQGLFELTQFTCTNFLIVALFALFWFFRVGIARGREDDSARSVREQEVAPERYRITIQLTISFPQAAQVFT